MGAATEKGSLPCGVEYQGKLHRDFELREQLVADTVEVLEDKVNGLRAAQSDGFFNVCIAAKRIVSLGEIPLKDITPDMLMGMRQDDFNEISSASKRLEEKRRRFQGTDEAGPENGDCSA